MRFFRGKFSFVAILLFSGAALAASQSDYDDCEQGADQQRRVAACTRVIQDRSESAVNRAIAYTDRGIGYREQGEFDRAIADHSESIKLNPKAASTYYNRGIAYEAKGDKAHATADFKKALALKPDLTLARDELNKLATAHPVTVTQQDNDDCDQESDGDRSIAGCTHLLDDPKQSPENRAAVYRQRGSAYKAKGDNDRAIADQSEVIRLNPKSAKGYRYRAGMWGAKGDYDRALPDYNEAIRLEPTAGNYGHRCWGRARSGRDLPQALSDCDQALRLAPNDASI